MHQYACKECACAHTVNVSINYFQDWTTDFNLFESGVKTNPNNVKLRNNYASQLQSANRIAEARTQYEV